MEDCTKQTICYQHLTGANRLNKQEGMEDRGRGPKHLYTYIAGYRSEIQIIAISGRRDNQQPAITREKKKYRPDGQAIKQVKVCGHRVIEEVCGMIAG